MTARITYTTSAFFFKVTSGPHVGLPVATRQDQSATPHCTFVQIYRHSGAIRKLCFKIDTRDAIASSSF